MTKITIARWGAFVIVSGGLILLAKGCWNQIDTPQKATGFSVQRDPNDTSHWSYDSGSFHSNAPMRIQMIDSPMEVGDSFRIKRTGNTILYEKYSEGKWKEFYKALQGIPDTGKGRGGR